MGEDEVKELTTNDLVFMSGLTLRQINWAIDKKLIVPIGGCKGSGVPNMFHPALGYELWVVKQRLDWGLSVEAAWRGQDPKQKLLRAPKLDYTKE